MYKVIKCYWVGLDTRYEDVTEPIFKTTKQAEQYMKQNKLPKSTHYPIPV